jgi:hypothetical protein
MESGKGFEIYLLSKYKRTLQKHFKKHIFSHLDALNLGLDLCAALSVCRRNGYVYANDKPGLGVDLNEEEAAKYPCEKTVTLWTQTRSRDGALVTP